MCPFCSFPDESIVSGHAARERVQVPQLGDWITASRLKRALLSWALLEGGVLGPWPLLLFPNCPLSRLLQDTAEVCLGSGHF